MRLQLLLRVKALLAVYHIGLEAYAARLPLPRRLQKLRFGRVQMRGVGDVQLSVPARQLLLRVTARARARVRVRLRLRLRIRVRVRVRARIRVKEGVGLGSCSSAMSSGLLLEREPSRFTLKT